MWIKILCIEYILWRILTTMSMFDVANMIKKNNCQSCANKLLIAFKHTGLFTWYSWEKGVHPSCKYWVVPLISTRVSGYSQVMLLLLFSNVLLAACHCCCCCVFKIRARVFNWPNNYGTYFFIGGWGSIIQTCKASKGDSFKLWGIVGLYL